MKPCPFCGSTKIMCEGSSVRIAMVCQRCLARGAETSGMPSIAMSLWNIQKPVDQLRYDLREANRVIREYDRELQNVREQVEQLSSAVMLLNEALIVNKYQSLYRFIVQESKLS